MVGTFLSGRIEAAPVVPPVRPVFISPAEAERLVEEESAHILDARGRFARAPYLPGAVLASWTDVRAGWLRDGRLADSGRARAHYANRGVRIDRPVVVYGAGLDGWGEEGRIWWDISVLGHPRAFILDGGIDGWRSAGRSLSRRPTPPGRGVFPRPAGAAASPRLRADHRDILDLRARGGLILDARSAAEYGGSTPYYSARGGHVPGAVHLHWKTLLDINGHMRPPDELTRRLAGVGLRPGRPSAVYCTGGVRSAFVVAVLTHLGYAARNYDGSWWDWARRDELPVE